MSKKSQKWHSQKVIQKWYKSDTRDYSRRKSDTRVIQDYFRVKMSNFLWTRFVVRLSDGSSARRWAPPKARQLVQQWDNFWHIFWPNFDHLTEQKYGFLMSGKIMIFMILNRTIFGRFLMVLNLLSDWSAVPCAHSHESFEIQCKFTFRQELFWPLC